MRVTCPECSGRKKIEAIVCGGAGCHPVTCACRFCGGTGEVSREAAERHAEGARRRADRIRRFVSLRQEAARLGLTPRDLGGMEHGRKVFPDAVPATAAISGRL